MEVIFRKMKELSKDINKRLDELYKVIQHMNEQLLKILELTEKFSQEYR